jgi:hypothetical protein
MEPTRSQPVPGARGAGRVGQALIGLGLLVVLGLAGIVGLAQTAQWFGLARIGGIVDDAELELDAWGPDAPGVHVWATIADGQADARRERCRIVARVRVGERTIAWYRSRYGPSATGRIRVALWPHDVVPAAAAALRGAASVTVQLEEVEIAPSGAVRPVRELGEHVLPVAPIARW